MLTVKPHSKSSSSKLQHRAGINRTSYELRDVILMVNMAYHEKDEMLYLSLFTYLTKKSEYGHKTIIRLLYTGCKM